jgi:hypothetical protein
MRLKALHKLGLERPTQAAKAAPVASQSAIVVPVSYRPTSTTSIARRLQFAKLMRQAYFARIVH